MGSAAPDGEMLHATAVAVDGRGLILLGASGSGKSAIALRLLAHGARLVADDRVHIRREGGALVARAPRQLRGLIEARGVGILKAEALDSASLVLAADLDAPEGRRLPNRRFWTCQGVALPCLHNPDCSHFPAALLQYLRGGGIADV